LRDFASELGITNANNLTKEQIINNKQIAEAVEEDSVEFN
jgi:hypothetical protein